ncbi:MAG TPA: YbhB/YbcL family Raf kinase inhibitor-like protein [Steroidobacteraceae bacterium]|nr:YbhB/YbcL family Raf kinase inhibitor-like protein [Steroidobacteraceae bacterium]
MNARLSSGHPRNWLLTIPAIVLGLAAGTSAAWDDDHRMTLHSATFTDGGTLPLSMISEIQLPNGQNACTADGSTGGNQSPQLSWRHAPEGTRSFAVVAYDITAQFTHWIIYNIPAGTIGLPDNAGVPGSSFGVQNENDFFNGVPGYNGPCPPPNVTPFAHQYQFTVYALDRMLPVVPAFGEFVPAGPEGFYQELLKAGLKGHVLASASISGFFSSTPGS